MTDDIKLETCVNELTAAAKTLTADWRRDNLTAPFGSNSTSVPYSIFSPDAPDHVRRSQRSILANLSKMQVMMGQPVDFLQRLAFYNQLLACLQWLCDFQVLACIPLEGSVPFKDVADISGVPEAQLSRVARMTATAGFLHEPRPGQVAHSPLSAQFVTHPALLDAAMFISETGAPAALKMSSATKQFPGSDRPERSAFNIAFDTSMTFAGCAEQRPKLQRQFSASLSCSTSDEDAGILDVLMRLDWRSLGSATVVEVGAQSTSMAISLATLFPSLRLVVQAAETGSNGPTSRPSIPNAAGGQLFPGSISGPRTPGSNNLSIPPHLTSRIVLQQRSPATPQSVKNASIYILRLPSPSPSTPISAIMSQAVSELNAHIEVLRANSASRLMLTALVLPAPGSVDLDTEAAARLRDLSLLQLANGRQAEMLEMVDVLNGVRDRDGSGGLVLTNEIRAPSCPFVAFEVRYQGYDEGKV